MIEEHCVDATGHEVCVGMRVDLIRDRNDADAFLFVAEYLPGERGTQGTNAPTLEIGERSDR